MRPLTLFAILTCGCAGGAIELGAIDQKTSPGENELRVPKTDTDIAKVGLRAVVTGKLPAEDKRNVYILVNPLNNPDTKNTWWVQEEVRRDGIAFRCTCQFGEPAQGSGEYFAIVGLVTDKMLAVGQQFSGLPDGKAFSKLAIVKRYN